MSLNKTVDLVDTSLECYEMTVLPTCAILPSFHNHYSLLHYGYKSMPIHLIIHCLYQKLWCFYQRNSSCQKLLISGTSLFGKKKKLPKINKIQITVHCSLPCYTGMPKSSEIAGAFKIVLSHEKFIAFAFFKLLELLSLQLWFLLW